MKHFILFPILLLMQCVDAQNLVLNGSFEDYTDCPGNFGYINYAVYWTVPTDHSSSDYYNECTPTACNVSVPNNDVGFQWAFDGNAYAGIYLYHPVDDYREYLEVPLSDTLVANGCYYFEMYVNLADLNHYTTDAIGAYFSDSAITGLTSFASLPYMPQISNIGGAQFDILNWTHVSGEFTANGGETYLIIGNFLVNQNTNITVVNSDSPYNGVYVLIDAVSLVACKTTEAPNEATEPTVRVYTNPGLTQVEVIGNLEKPAEFILYDLNYRVVFRKSFLHSETMEIQRFPKGLYIYEVKVDQRIISKGKLVIH